MEVCNDLATDGRRLEEEEEERAGKRKWVLNLD